ncbi:MAG: conjugal transfer protein TraB [Deltaproteobacteria bacterium]|nr:MAG: conjugal transfer protein TraB [Deltaproteobacteria bacterium]
MNSTHDFPARDYGDDVHLVQVEGKKIILIGTAHISRESVELVQEVIGGEDADCVCLELDDRRFQALANKEKWQGLDLKQVIRKKQLATLLASMLMASYQKRLGGSLGVSPGAELLAASLSAKEKNIPVSLCDRDIRITLRRAWASTSLLKKGYLISSLLASVFDKTEVSEEKLRELKQKDMLAELMDELGGSFPDLKKVLIDERDIYLAEKIKRADGSKIIAVVGAGHIAGLKKMLLQDKSGVIEEITAIPPVSKIWKVIGWSIPVLILLSLAAIGFKQGASAAGANLLYWVLANGIPCSVGAVLALAHPLTVLSAFLAAPITSLTPVIGAGYVTAFVQVMLKPPVVREFEQVGADMVKFTGWWKNRLLRVFLVFFLTGFGSVIGTYVGGYEIVKNLFG